MTHPPAETTPGRARHAVLLVLVAWVLFASLVAAHWSVVVDDLYISIAFARSLAEQGTLTWPGGGRIEGYSDPTWVALLSLGRWVGLDPSLWAKVAATLFGFGTLAAVGGLASRSRRSVGPLLLAATTWAPLSYWAATGMESTAYGLVLLLSWWTLARRPAQGAALFGLFLAALTRPEGHLHLAVGLLVHLVARHRAGLSRVSPQSLGVLLALAAYHGLRTWWFDGFLPPPILSKGLHPPLGLSGIEQLGADLLVAAPLLALGLLGTRLTTRRASLALLPLLLQTAVLVKAGGDWMGWGRLVFPGVLGTIGVLLALPAVPHSSNRTRVLPWALALVPTILVYAPGGVTPGLEWIARLGSPVAAIQQGVETPLHQDVSWMVRHVPRGRPVVTCDVGFPGNIPDLWVQDPCGLVDADIARARTLGDAEADARVMARYDTERTRPFAVRGRDPDHAPEDMPDDWADRYPARTDYRTAEVHFAWFAESSTQAPHDLQVARWRALAEVFPSHPWIRWRLAAALLEAGDIERAVAVQLDAAARWPEVPALSAGLPSLIVGGGSMPVEFRSGRGFVMPFDGRLHSIELPSSHLELVGLRLDVDDPDEDGARATILWATDSGVVEEEVSLFEPRVLSPPTEHGVVRSFTVAFTNDASGEDWDRNLYVLPVVRGAN